MQLRGKDLCGYSYEYLHPGYCGPICVNQIWSENLSGVGYGYSDEYMEYGYGCAAYRPRRVIKAEIECESPEVLNSILGQISNIVACPFDDPVKDITDKAQEELASAINDKIVETLNNIVNEIRAERENSKRYKLKHKVLKTN